MRLPRWVSLPGLVEHLFAGFLITLIVGPWLAPGWPLLLSLVIGVIHELYDGDFLTADGAPWNGILDTLAFLPVPLFWWEILSYCK